MAKVKKAKPGTMPRQVVDPLASFCLPVVIYDKTRDGSQHMVETENATCEEICLQIITDLNINPTMMHCFSLAVMDDEADGRPTWLSWRDKVDRKLELSIVHFRMRFVPNIKRQNDVCTELLLFDKDCFQYLCWQVNWDFLHDKLESAMNKLTEAKVYGIAVVGLLISLRLETEFRNDGVEDVNKFLNKISLNDFMPPSYRKGIIQRTFGLKKSVKERLNSYQEHYPPTQINSTQLMISYVKKLLEDGQIHNKERYRACQLVGGSEARQPVNVSVEVDMTADCPSLAIRPDQDGSGGLPWKCNLKDFINLVISTEEVAGTTFWSVFIIKSGEPEVQFGYNPMQLQQQTLYFERESECMSFVSCLETFHRLAFDFYSSLCANFVPVCVEVMRSLRCHGPATDEFIINKLRHQYKTKVGEHYALRMSLSQHNTYDILYLPTEHGKQQSLGKVLKTEEDLYVIENTDVQHKELRLLLCEALRRKGLDPKSCTATNPHSEGCNKLQMFLLQREEKTMVERAEEHEARRRQDAQAKVFMARDVSVKQLLAQGHFTETHSVTLRRETDTYFVSKSIHTSVIGNSSYRNLEEALLEGMNHLMLLREMKHFVSFVGMSMTPVPGMLMKWAPYGGLKQFLQDPPREVRLTLQHLVHVMVHVGATLKYMEENGLYHGNLHADNILVFKFESDVMGVKVGDPGLVSLYNKLSLDSHVNRGRMPWLAPELYSDLTRMDIKTDVFAYGTTMWQMFSDGCSPLQADPKLQGKSVHQVRQFFETGQIMSCPHHLKVCPDDNLIIKTLKSNIFELMKCCWMVDRENRLDSSRLLSRINLDIQSYGNAYHEYNIIPSVHEFDRSTSAHEFDGSTADSYPLAGVSTTGASTTGASSGQVTTSGVIMNSSFLTTPPVQDLVELGNRAESAQETIYRRVPSTFPLSQNEQHDRNDVEAHRNTPADVRVGVAADAHVPPQPAQAPTASQPLPVKPSEARVSVRPSAPSIPVTDVRHLIQDSRLEIDTGVVLGKGHYGAVYKGTLKPSNSNSNSETKNIVVAVKVLKPDQVEKYSDDFRKEAKLMETLNNENIVKFYGVARYGERLIMEFMDKGSLQKYVQGSRKSNRILPRSEKLKFAIDIAKGMEYLEQCNVVHCDLAARNVLLSANLQAKISDFGLSKILAQNKDYYRRQIGVQKTIPILWCAPEWINQQSCSSKSDVWSFAVVLWEIYSYGGIPNPLPKDVPLQEITLHLHKNVRLQKPRECEDEVYELMNRCWNWNPAPRPTFTECQEWLVKFLEKDNVSSSLSANGTTAVSLPSSNNLTPSGNNTSPRPDPSLASQANSTNSVDTPTTVTIAPEKGEADADLEPIGLDEVIVRNELIVSSPAQLLVDDGVEVPVTAGQVPVLSSPAAMLHDGIQGGTPLFKIPVPQTTDPGIYSFDKSGPKLINVADGIETDSMGSIGMGTSDSQGPDFSESVGAETIRMRTNLLPVTDTGTKQAPVIVTTTTGINGALEAIQQTHGGNMKTAPAESGENIPVPVSFGNVEVPSRPGVPGSCPIEPQSHLTSNALRKNQVELDSTLAEGSSVFSSHPLSSGLRNGLQRKKYQLGKVIGKGGFGEVWLATYEGRTVAAKRSTKKETYARFQRELNILKALDHPNIVQYVTSDREESGDQFLYFMEYLERGDLRKYLMTCKASNVPATCRCKLKFLMEIAQGLQYLYDERILHLDLTAQNILLTKDLTAKICDFGWAKPLEGDTVDTTYHRVDSMLQYVWAAVESYVDNVFTRFSDTWSFGVVCIEVFLDGQEPRFTDQPRGQNHKDKAQCVADHIQKGERFPCPPSCPNDVYQEVVYKCWKRKPVNRIRFPVIIDKLKEAFEGTR